MIENYLGLKEGTEEYQAALAALSANSVVTARQIAGLT